MRRMAASCEQQVSNCGCSTTPIGKMGCEIVSTAACSGFDLAIDVRGEGSFQPKGAVVAGNVGTNGTENCNRSRIALEWCRRSRGISCQSWSCSVRVLVVIEAVGDGRFGC